MLAGSFKEFRDVESLSKINNTALAVTKTLYGVESRAEVLFAVVKKFCTDKAVIGEAGDLYVTASGLGSSLPKLEKVQRKTESGIEVLDFIEQTTAFCNAGKTKLPSLDLITVQF